MTRPDNKARNQNYCNQAKAFQHTFTLLRYFLSFAGASDDGQPWNHQRVHRVYCALRLNIPRRTRRRIPQRIQHPLVAPDALNTSWTLDFMFDTLYDGRHFRTLNIIDPSNREGLAIEIGRTLPSLRVIARAGRTRCDARRPALSASR